MEEIVGELKSSEKEIEKRKSGLKNFFFGWIKDNYDKVFLGVLVLSLILDFLIFQRTINQTLWYDEASYMATAQKWGLGTAVNDIWYYRRGLLWPLFSSLFYFVGIGEVGVRFMMALFSTGVVAVSYFLIKEMFNKKLALLVSLAISTSWIILFFNGRVLTDTPSTFFILLSVLFFWKGYVLKKGDKFIPLFFGFYALAMMVRMQNLMFMPAFLLFLLFTQKLKFLKNKHFWIGVGIFLLIITPYVLLYNNHYGNPIQDLLAHYGGVSSQGIVAPGDPLTFSKLFEYFIDLPYILSGQLMIGRIIFLLFLIGVFYFFIDLFLGFDKIFKNEEIQKRFFILLWIVIPLLVLGYMTNYPEERYVTPLLMFLFVIAFYPLEKLQKLIMKKPKMTEKTAYAIIFLILSFLFVFTVIWGFQLTDAKKTSYAEVREAGLWLNQNSNPGDIIITPSQPQILYYSQRSTYIEGANESEFKELISTLKPRFLMISAFEENKDWLLNYTQTSKDLTPVKAYQQNNQPILVIYEINYKK